VLVVGSGGVEKNIDLILCRRFKGRGMSWSRAGAQNLLKLRLLKYDRKDWKSYWRSRIVRGKFFQKLRFFQVGINWVIEKAEAEPRLSQFMATLSLVIP
jgi:hypothetical protein